MKVYYYRCPTCGKEFAQTRTRDKCDICKVELVKK